MKRATLCADTTTAERQILVDWLTKWRDQLGYCSENEGCGCCIDIYNVEAPESALTELPQSLLSESEWANS